MRREARTPRQEWRKKVEHWGLLFHTVDDKPYWNEGAAYIFDRAEIETLEKATNELHEMCLEAVERVVSQNLYERFGIPEKAHKVIADSWEADPPAIYGRFDLSFDGTGPPKLLEFNADTPTSLLEAAVVQWHWLQEAEPAADQFNSIWEGLTKKWQNLKEEGLFPSGIVHFCSMDEMEDLMTVAVMVDSAGEAGLKAVFMHLTEVGWDVDERCFVDLQSRRIETLFKLYPWEWVLQDRFGQFALETYTSIQWIEPIWKMILSNKAILPLLWEMYPDHPNLLPAFMEGPREMKSYVKKPFLGREGANVSIVTPDSSLDLPGPYGKEGFIYQEYAPLPCFDGNHAVIGSWVVDCEARGIGVRESDGPITEDLARFVPHYFKPLDGKGNAVS
jgi:glutathionylspermidine synthase